MKPAKLQGPNDSGVASGLGIALNVRFCRVPLFLMGDHDDDASGYRSSPW